MRRVLAMQSTPERPRAHAAACTPERGGRQVAFSATGAPPPARDASITTAKAKRILGEVADVYQLNMPKVVGPKE